MSKTTDTDGILDRCHCGAHAGFGERESVGHDIGASTRAHCTECPETTGWYVTKVGAMIGWNKMIRDIKQKERLTKFAKQCRANAGLPNDQVSIQDIVELQCALASGGLLNTNKEHK